MFYVSTNEFCRNFHKIVINKEKIVMNKEKDLLASLRAGLKFLVLNA